MTARIHPLRLQIGIGSHPVERRLYALHFFRRQDVLQQYIAVGIKVEALCERKSLGHRGSPDRYQSTLNYTFCRTLVRYVTKKVHSSAPMNALLSVLLTSYSLLFH